MIRIEASAHGPKRTNYSADWVVSYLAFMPRVHLKFTVGRSLVGTGRLLAPGISLSRAIILIVL
jgi:hypothetical protein